MTSSTSRPASRSIALALALSAFLLPALPALAHRATNQTLLYAQVQTGEVMNQDGVLRVNFLGKTLAAGISPWDVEPFVEAPDTFTGFRGAELEVEGGFPPHIFSDEPLPFRFRITYAPEELPFYLQRFRLGLRDRHHPETVKYSNFYLYFTPYGTVEILDLEAHPDPLPLGLARVLARDWLSPANGPRPRQPIPRNAIPQSDLTLEELMDETVPKRFVLVPGLAYQIPFRASDPDPDPAGGAPRKAAGAWIFNGTVTGTVLTAVELERRPADDLLPLSGLQVDLEVADTGWVGPILVNTSTVIDTAYTDANGEFSFSLIDHRHDSQILDLFVTVRAENEDGTIRVRKRLGAAVRNESIRKDDPLTVLAGSFGTVDFGEIETDNHILKGQLLHWAIRAKEFAEDELDGSFSFPAGRRLDIMIGATEPVTCSSAGLFLPGGLKTAFALIVSAFTDPTGPGLLPGLSAAGALFSLSNKDTIYICSTDETERGSGTISHEFGHYLMYHLQNRWWPDFRKAGPYNHGFAYNNPWVQLSLTEGWANGFEFIMHTVNRHEDQNPNPPTDEETWQDFDFAGSFHKHWVEDGGLVTPDVQTLTHGFLSEYYIGHLIYDLWDGPNNLRLGGNELDPELGTSEYDDDGNDEIEMSFLEIATPLLNNRPAATSPSGAIGVLGAGSLLKSVHGYHAALLDQISSREDKALITRLFDFNRIHHLGEDLLQEKLQRNHLNTDSLSFDASIDTPNFKDLDVDLDDESLTNPGYRVPTALGIPPITLSDFSSQGLFRVSIHQLDGIVNDYNLFPDPLFPTLTNYLSDHLTIRDEATLFLHRDSQREFQNVNNEFGEPTTGLLPTTGHRDIDLIGDSTLCIGDGGRLVVGDPGGDHTATLHVREGCTLMIEAGGILRINVNSKVIIHKGGTLLYRAGAFIKLMGGEPAELDIRGNWQIENGADFTFEGPGHIRTELDSPITPEDAKERREANITIVAKDVNGEFVPVEPVETASASITLLESIHPGKQEDTLLIVADDTYLRPPETELFNIRFEEGIVQLGKDSFIDMAWGSCQLTDLAIVPSGGEQHRGVFIHGRPATIDGVCVSGGLSGITIYQEYKLDPILPRPPAANWQRHHDIQESEFVSNEFGLYTVGGSCAVYSTIFETNRIGWNAELPRDISRVEDNAGLRNVIAYRFDGDGSIAMVNFCRTRIEGRNGAGTGIDAAGGVGVFAQHCTIKNNAFGFSMGDDCLLDLSNESYNDCENNKVTMRFEAAQPPLLVDGYNLLGAASLPAPFGYVMTGTLTDPCGVIDASNNSWDPLGGGGLILGPVSGMHYDLQHVSDPTCTFTVIDASPLSSFNPPDPPICRNPPSSILPPPGADQDKDGVADLLEIFQGRSLSLRESLPAIAPLAGPDNRIGLTFQQAYRTYRIIGVPEWSTDMKTWRSDGFRRSRALQGAGQVRRWLNTATLDPATIAGCPDVFVRLRVQVRRSPE